jgi:hypothetical protein
MARRNTPACSSGWVGPSALSEHPASPSPRTARWRQLALAALLPSRPVSSRSTVGRVRRSRNPPSLGRWNRGLRYANPPYELRASSMRLRRRSARRRASHCRFIAFSNGAAAAGESWAKPQNKANVKSAMTSMNGDAGDRHLGLSWFETPAACAPRHEGRRCRFAAFGKTNLESSMISVRRPGSVRRRTPSPHQRRFARRTR